MKRAIPVILLSGLLSACGIPDLKPFSDATAEMATVLKQGFERARATLGEATDTASDSAAFKAHLLDLDKRWEPTRKALSSLVAYSDALAAVAEAGKKGKETMGQVTGALNDLSVAVGALPIAGAGKTIIDAVGAKIIEMQAAKDIRKAVDKAAEAVDLMAPLLEKNFADLRKIHLAAAAAWESRVNERSRFSRGYYDTLVLEQQRLEYLLTLIVDYQSAPARHQWRAALARARGDEDLAVKFLGSISQEQTEVLNALKAADPGCRDLNTSGADLAAKVEARQQQLLDLINAQRQEIALLDAAYRQATADLTAVGDARATGDRVLRHAGEAIVAWQKAHRSLQAAAEKQQSRPSVADLLSIVKESATLLN